MDALMASCVLQDPGLQESAPGGRKIRQPADRNQTGGHRAAAEHFPDAGSVFVLFFLSPVCQRTLSGQETPHHSLFGEGVAA